MNSINEMSKWNLWLNYFNSRSATQCKSIPSDMPVNSTVSSSYYFIFDCQRNSILYACDCFERILGYTKDDYSLMDIISFIHPEDSDYVLNCERKATSFMSSLSEEEVFNYSINYSYRTRTEYGNYIHIRQNYQALELNPGGVMTRLLVFIEVLEGGNYCKKDDFKIMERQLNSRINLTNDFNLTKRESEVLELIKQGLTSVEISNRLYVSKFTVDTHRKNILAKAKNRKFITIVKEGIS